MTRTAWLFGSVRSHARALIYTGTALALAGAGTASAATASAATAAPAAKTAPGGGAAQTVAALRQALAGKPQVASPVERPAPVRPAAAKPSAHHPPAQKQRSATWAQVRSALNRQTNPVAAARHTLPFADQLMPVGASGPQSAMPITPDRYANAATIVRQALAKRMGVRSAVIAVATAMQESTLLNLGYGSADSLGLFQQRPSCGWGTAAQITDPAYAAGAFLDALHQHQSADHSWARQPLWASAQAVQASGFPYAYAKWENQAAHLVATIATRLR